jgi:hypothetical protein
MSESMGNWTVQVIHTLLKIYNAMERGGGGGGLQALVYPTRVYTVRRSSMGYRCQSVLDSNTGHWHFRAFLQLEGRKRRESLCRYLVILAGTPCGVSDGDMVR